MSPCDVERMFGKAGGSEANQGQSKRSNRREVGSVLLWLPTNIIGMMEPSWGGCWLMGREGHSDRSEPGQVAFSSLGRGP